MGAVIVCESQQNHKNKRKNYKGNCHYRRKCQQRHTIGGISMAKKHLVIVESPAKAKTIERYLGKDYVVKASMGHLRDLPKSKLGVDIENDFEPVYQPIRDKS